MGKPDAFAPGKKVELMGLKVGVASRTVGPRRPRSESRSGQGSENKPLYDAALARVDGSLGSVGGTVRDTSKASLSTVSNAAFPAPKEASMRRLDAVEDTTLTTISMVQAALKH